MNLTIVLKQNPYLATAFRNVKTKKVKPCFISAFSIYERSLAIATVRMPILTEKSTAQSRVLTKDNNKSIYVFQSSELINILLCKQYLQNLIDHDTHCFDLC